MARTKEQMKHAKKSILPRPDAPGSKDSNHQQFAQSFTTLKKALEIAGHQDAELLSRLDYYRKLAQEVDEYYEYNVFVGRGKRAIKRAFEYMSIQQGINDCICDDIHELTCRQRVRDDILLLTRMVTKDPLARIAKTNTKP